MSHTVDADAGAANESIDVEVRDTQDAAAADEGSEEPAPTSEESAQASEKPAPVAEESSEPLGYCRATEPRQCEVNADCPAPSVCEQEICVVSYAPCDANSDCDALYVCTDTGETTCREDLVSASNLPDAGTGADGECTEVSLKLCLPKLEACDTDADCGEWVCFALPREGNPPVGWQEFERACLPPGVAAGILREVETKSPFASSGGASSGGEGAAIDVAEGVAPEENTDGDLVEGAAGAFDGGEDSVARGDTPDAGDDGDSVATSDAAASEDKPGRDEADTDGAGGGDEADSDDDGGDDDGGCAVASAPASHGRTSTLAALSGLLIGGVTLLRRRRSR